MTTRGHTLIRLVRMDEGEKNRCLLSILEVMYGDADLELHQGKEWDQSTIERVQDVLDRHELTPEHNPGEENEGLPTGVLSSALVSSRQQ